MPEACKISAPGRRPRLEIHVAVAQRHGLHGSQKCRRTRDRSRHRRPPRPARHPHSRCRLRRRCDATYSNYQEANRAFYRQTVIPLALRTARALSDWLGSSLSPSFTGRGQGEGQQHTREGQQQILTFRPDLDAIEALNPEREALWARLEKTSFLTTDEKRALVGYGPDTSPTTTKFNPNHDDRGRFTSGDGTDSENPDTAVSDGQPPPANDGDGDDGPQSGTGRGELQNIAFRRQFPNATPAQQLRVDQALAAARRETNRTRELDPNWRGPDSTFPAGSVEGAIAHFDTVARAAQARLGEITRDALPGTNPSWGVNRLRAELNERGFTLQRPARGDGLIFENPTTGEELRIMERPVTRWRSDPAEKHTFEYYYRYRSQRGAPEGTHIPIPDKK
jgi:hypothetical protein